MNINLIRILRDFFVAFILMAGVADASFILPESKWPNPTNIPVCWESTGFAQEKAWLRAYVESLYENHPDFEVDFKGWGQCHDSSKGIRIKFHSNSSYQGGSGSKIGTALDGVEDGMFFKMNNRSQFSDPRRWFSRIGFMAAHEFAHALGLLHEHEREDTPLLCWVKLDEYAASFGNEDWEWEPATIGTPIGNWDDQSLVNYCSSSSGNLGALSQGDVEGLKTLYPRTRGINVYYRAGETQLIRLTFLNGQWSFGNVFQEANNAFRYASGDPSSIRHRGAQHVFYRQSEEIVQLGTWSGSWSDYCITYPLLAPIAAGNPKALGLLDFTHVFYRGTDRHIHQLFNNTQNWHNYDISAATNAPLADGDPAVYNIGNSIHVVYRGVDNHIHKLEWEILNGWRHLDLSVAAEALGVIAPLAQDDPVAVTTGIEQFIFYRGTDNRIYKLWGSYIDDNFWNFNRIYYGPPAAVSQPTVASRGRHIFVTFRTEDNHVRHLTTNHVMVQTPLTQPVWTSLDLSTLPNSTPLDLAHGTPTSILLSNSLFIFYKGADEEIHALVKPPSIGWQTVGNPSLGENLGTPIVSGQPSANLN